MQIHQLSSKRGILKPDEPPAIGTSGAQCTLEVEGMDCAGCASTVERALRAVPGVEKVQTNVMAQRVEVHFSSNSIGRSELVAAVGRVGYRVKQNSPRQQGHLIETAVQRSHLLLAGLSGLLWVGSLAAGQFAGSGRVASAMAVGAIVFGGWYIVPKGLRAARNRSLDMNFLMSVAAIGALFIGEYAEAASAMFLFALAQLLESYSMDRARNSIRSLMDLSPSEASVLRDGKEERIPIDGVAVGETVIVRPGERLPVDGVVLSGSSRVNQAPVTGESLPVKKEIGAEVFAGTINGNAALEVRSTKAATDSTLARIIHAVEEAQASRAPTQTFVDRFARVYTPAVLAIALATAVLPPLVGAGSWSEWFYRALVLLVVACPCALVISTPVTVVSALAGAARRGILIKGGLHLENAGRVQVIAIDKTGTLTEGKFEVAEILEVGELSGPEILAIAAGAELRSEHPIARAVVRHAESQRVAYETASETVAVPGEGVRARVGRRTVLVGNSRLFDGPLEDDAKLLSERLSATGRTVVLVGIQDDAKLQLIGAIAVGDRVRPGALSALKDLHAAGIKRIVVLTGDHERTTNAVVAGLGGLGGGIDEVQAGLLPEDKVDAIRRLQKRHGLVAMVGDGVNDAPALALADVGFAMGSAGTDVALETADIALMGDDLSKLAVAVRLSRKAQQIIRTNIYFSIATKAVFVGFAIFGVATLWMAVLADMGASLLVVMNGLRASRLSA